jgi:hypothetical protein
MSSARSSVVFGAAVLAVLVLSSGVQAQCHQGGGPGGGGRSGGPGMNGGLALLQQQQRQQLQQIVLQQQLQELDRQVRELAKADPSAVEEALQSPLATTRWVAARVVTFQSLPLQDGLIKLLTDPDLFVRQAARQGLISLSAQAQRNTDKERPSARRVDFGPLPSAGPAAQAQAARKWHDWWKKLDASQTEPANKLVKTDKSSAPRGGSPLLLSTVKVEGGGQGRGQNDKR